MPQLNGLRQHATRRSDESQAAKAAEMLAARTTVQNILWQRGTGFLVMYKHDCYLCSWKKKQKKNEIAGPLLQLKTEEKHLSLFFKNKLLLGLWT